jgi:hypothetical protein
VISNAKQGIINPDNKDTNCLIWALLIGLHQAPRNPGRVSQYKHLFDTIKVPKGVDVTCMSLQWYRRLEEANDISFNVYKWEESGLKGSNDDDDDDDEEEEEEEEEEDKKNKSNCKSIMKICFMQEYRTRGEKEKHVNLLLISNGKWKPGETEIWHFLANVHGTRNGAVLICNSCSYTTASQKSMDRHTVHGCYGGMTVDVPKSEKRKIYFKNLKKCSMIPILMNADLEAILEAIDQTENLSREIKPSNTVKHQKHRCISFSLVVVNSLLPDHPPQLLSYVGEDAA